MKHPKTVRYDPKEVQAIGDWLNAMVRDEPDMKLVLRYDGKDHEVSKQHFVNVLYSAFRELELARRIEDCYEVAGRLHTMQLIMNEKVVDRIRTWYKCNDGIPWDMLSEGLPHKGDKEQEWQVPKDTFNYLCGCQEIVECLEGSWRFCSEFIDKVRPKQRSFHYNNLVEHVQFHGCSVATDEDVRKLWERAHQENTETSQKKKEKENAYSQC